MLMGARRDLHADHGQEVVLSAEELRLVRLGHYRGTIGGRRVIGRLGIAAMIGVKPASLKQARMRRGNSQAGPLDLPDPLFYAWHRGAKVHLYDLAAVRDWAAQTGRLRAGP